MPGTFKVVGDFWFNTTDLTLWRGQEYIQLTPKAGAILCELLTHPGQILTPEQLLETVWPGTHVQPEVLKVYIFELRRVLGEDPKRPRYIETIPRQGHRLIASVQDAEPSPLGGGPPDAPELLVGPSPATETFKAAFQTEAPKQLLRLAFEVGRMGMWEWDVETERVQWSPGLEVIHGRAAGDAPQTFEGVLADIHSEDREHFIDTVRLALQEPQREFEIEYRVVGSDGEIRWVQGRGKVYRDATGRPLRMEGVCLEIIDRKKGR